jgi:DNA-binding response OmpR family regulator
VRAFSIWRSASGKLPAPTANAPSTNAVKRILIAYDDPILASALNLHFESANLAVATAQSSEEARRLIKEGSPDFVLFDYFLPGSQNLLHELRRKEDSRSAPSLIFLNRISRLNGNAAAAGVTFILDEDPRPQAMLKGLASALKLTPADSTRFLDHAQSRQPLLVEQILKDRQRWITDLRVALQIIVRGNHDLKSINGLVKSVHRLSARMAFAGLEGAYRVTSGLEAFALELHGNPKLLYHSSLRTLCQTADLLFTLISPENLEQAKEKRPARIFCVDDEPSIREAVTEALSPLNIETASASNASLALTHLDQERADLILLDIGLPDQNGFHLSSQIRSLPFHKETPIVFLTGLDTFQNRAQAKLSGGDDFLSKPFSLWALGLNSLYWIINSKLSSQDPASQGNGSFRNESENPASCQTH